MGTAWGLDSSERGFWSWAPREGRGSGVSSLRFFVQSRDLPSPHVVQSPYLPDPLLSEPPVRSTGQKPLPPGLQVGRTVRTPPPEDSFLFVKRLGDRGWPV